MRFVGQTSIGDCGPACLEMIYSAHGIDSSARDISGDIGPFGPNGATARQLVDHARTMGFEAYGVRARSSALTALPLPLVLHFWESHWVVLAEADEEAATIWDPLTSKHRISLGALEQSWAGIAIVLERTSQFTDDDRPARHRANQKPHAQPRGNNIPDE